MRRLGALSFVAAALLAVGCKEKDPDYCADASMNHYSCKEADAAAHDATPAPHDATDAGDAREVGDAGEVGDALAEKVDVPPEVKPPECTIDDDCPSDGGLRACDKSGPEPKCVACTDSAKHCKDATKPACDTTAHQCAECVGTGTECTFAPGKTACNKTAQKCVECVDDTKCAGTKPVCGTDQKCRPCAADAECKAAPSVCVDYDGHCATTGEVVFLERGGVCDAPTSHYCTSATAVAALKPEKPILVISGTMAVGALELSGAVPDPVLVVGKGTPLVGAGSGDMAGVHVSGVRKAYVRDLKISGGTVGVLAEQGADLRLTRCTIVQNMAGGIHTEGASFDVTNTIVAANDQGDPAGGVIWAGVRLGALPTGGKGRFENNTVVDNKQVGIACTTTYDVKTNIIYNNVGGQSVNCGTPACCGAANPDPMLDASYRLKVGSPCIDKLPLMSVTTDIQGQPRTGMIDCGADEYVP